MVTQSGSLEGNLAALVHHVELSKAGWRDRALESMLLATCFSAGSPLSSEEISTRLNDQLDAPIGRAQVESIIEVLVSRGSLVPTPDGSFKISEAAWAELEDNFSAAEDLEEAVQETFQKHFSDIDDEHTPSWERFKAEFVNPLITDLGAQTYEIVSSGRGAVENSAVHTRFLEPFPQEVRPDLTEAISQFFDPSNSAVRRFVLSRLNATFLVQATGLSEEAFEALIDATSRRLNMDVFIDTNFLFSLIGLHENPADDVVEALDSLIQKTGGQTDVSLYVLPITLNEARETVGRKKDHLSGIVVDKRLASAIRQGSSHFSGIALKYFREARTSDSPISAEEYFEPYLENLLEICRSKGVELYNTELDDLRNDQAVIDDLNDEKERQEEFRAKGAKPYPVILHDMVLWHFVDRQRPEDVESPVEAQHWIATIDFGFLGFDRRKKKESGRALPLAVHPTVLLQMLQFWVPQSEELEVALINSLQPLLPHEFDAEAERVTLKILRVLSRYENVSDLGEETLGNIFVDDAVRSRVQETEDLEEQIEIVESAIIEQTKELRERAEDLEGEKEELQHQLEARAERVEDIQSELEKLRERRDEAERQLERERDRREGLESRIEELERDAERRKQDQERRRWRGWFMGGCLVWLFALAAVGFFVLGSSLAETTPLSSGPARGLGVATCSAFALVVAEFVGARLKHVQDSWVYRALHTARKWLWGLLVALGVSVLAAYLEVDLGIGGS